MNGVDEARIAAGKVAILIVNGGNSAHSNRWIQLCLDKIAEHTRYPHYHVYVWNNRIDDPDLEDWLEAQPRLTLLSAAAYETLHHPHRTPLQRLYTLARQEGAKYIVAMDNDAHPMQAGWLTQLVDALDHGAAVAGVWRQEMTPAIRAHVHASCLCTTVDFIERYQLRFEFDNTHSQEKTDTLAHFTWVAEAEGLPIHKLMRSNQREFHYWFGGIYGDSIYHHVAASRDRVVFHNSPSWGVTQSDQHRRLRDETAELLFADYASYMAWLTGLPTEPALDTRIRKLAAQADTARTPSWWFDRARSSYVRAQARNRLVEKTKAAVTRVPWSIRILRSEKLRRLRPLSPKNQGPPYNNDAMTRAFQEENLFPVPLHGWRAGPPDYVGIGPPKCGTTWWYSLIFSHPQIVPNRVLVQNPHNKELQYFVHFRFGAMGEQARQLYRNAFATCPGTICGEFSTQYFLYPGALAHLADTAPQAKILIILRNPIDRFISHWNHLITRRGRSFATLSERQVNVFKHYSAYSEAMQASRYGGGLAMLFQQYSREQVLVLQYERMVIAPEIELARTYRFLGVDDRFRPLAYRDAVNKGEYAIPKPTSDDRRRLAAYLKRDVDDTLTLCPEIDPALWPDFT